MRLVQRIFLITLAACLLVLPQINAASAESGAGLPKPGAVNGAQGIALIRILGNGLFILDVRTQAEFAEGHIPDAVLIPIEELAARRSEVPSDRPVLIVCRTGRRAQAAYNLLQSENMRNDTLWYLQATPHYTADGSFRFN